MDPLEYGGINNTQIDIEEAAPDLMHLLRMIEIDIEHVFRRRRLYRAGKRMLDIVMSIAALVVLLPFLLLVALVIFIDDPHGSPFYISARCGKDGRQFKFIKFRSMKVGAEQQLDDLLHINEMDGPVFKIKDDPRITRIGRFIRKCSIDELPQLINVIKGEMSLVGPRPPLPREVEQYNAYHMHRLSVRPGLTCYWQVQPNRNAISFDSWVELDMKYILERSMLVDIRLIIKTIGVMVKCEGE